MNQFEQGGRIIAVADPDWAAMGALPRRAVEIALAELARGVQELPLGSNRGTDVDRYLIGRRGDGQYLLDAGGGRGAPWCARFVLWCVEGAAADLSTTSPTKGWGDLASGLKWRANAQLANRWRSDPRPGMVGIMVSPDEKRRHVTLLLRVFGDGLACSVEGNWRHRIAVVKRPASAYAGFVDLETPSSGRVESP